MLYWSPCLCDVFLLDLRLRAGLCQCCCLCCSLSFDKRQSLEEGVKYFLWTGSDTASLTRQAFSSAQHHQWGGSGKGCCISCICKWARSKPHKVFFSRLTYGNECRSSVGQRFVKFRIWTRWTNYILEVTYVWHILWAFSDFVPYF